MYAGSEMVMDYSPTLNALAFVLPIALGICIGVLRYVKRETERQDRRERRAHVPEMLAHVLPTTRNLHETAVELDTAAARRTSGSKPLGARVDTRIDLERDSNGTASRSHEDVTVDSSSAVMTRGQRVAGAMAQNEVKLLRKSS
jgi:hypothetical protein